LSCKKTRLAPGGIPEQKVQRKFIKLIIRTIKKAGEENSEVVFLDPTHQVHNTVNGYAWQQTGAIGTKIIARMVFDSKSKALNVITPVNNK